MLMDEDENVQKKQQSNPNQEWIKPKTTPLTINICDFSRINKFYSHKSLQKYIRYLFADSCPNPMWLSIKRKSQVERIVFVDIQVENNLFHKNFKLPKAPEQQETEKQCQEEGNILKFLPQFDKVDIKAIFRQAPFARTSKDLWDSLLIYDEESVKDEVQLAKKNVQLEEKLSQ